jgi:hypothetical protein
MKKFVSNTMLLMALAAFLYRCLQSASEETGENKPVLLSSTALSQEQILRREHLVNVVMTAILPKF